MVQRGVESTISMGKLKCAGLYKLIVEPNIMQVD